MKALGAAALIALTALPGQAATVVTWGEWVPRTDYRIIDGSFTIGSQVITVTAESTSDFRAVERYGSNYLGGDAYTKGSVVNSPEGRDLVWLNVGGTITFTFSQAVQQVFFAFVSWNPAVGISAPNQATFSQAVTLDSIGTGHWGAGTASTSGNVASFTGEAHGVLTLGPTRGFTLQHNSENWHGFTLGVTPALVPVPASAPLLAGGIAAFALLRRKRR